MSRSIAGSAPGGQLMLTSDVENYPGFPEGIDGPDLMRRFREQAERFGTQFLSGDVERVDLSARPFRLEAESLDGPVTVLADTLIIATGVLFILAGAARLGGMSDFIARPVLRGFTFGLALTIAIKQLPKILDVDTDHIHDLFFAPLFEGLTRPWNLPRWEGGPFHTQRFESTVATSCPVSFAATGVEVGRRHTFARDQYFPLVAHKSRGDSVDYLALQVPASVTVTEGSIGYDARIFATLTSDGPRVTCVLRTSERPRWQRAELTCGALSLWCTKEPDLMEITELPLGFSTRLEWDVPVLPVQVVPQSYL